MAHFEDNQLTLFTNQQEGSADEYSGDSYSSPSDAPASVIIAPPDDLAKKSELRHLSFCLFSVGQRGPARKGRGKIAGIFSIWGVG